MFLIDSLKKISMINRYEITCEVTGHSFVFETNALLATGSVVIDYYSFSYELVRGFFSFAVKTNPVDYNRFKDSVRHAKKITGSDFTSYKIVSL